jgi:ribosomal protein L11 methyltransferase
MPWLQLSIDIDGGDVERLTELFNAAGALSVTSLDAGNEPLLEPAPGETPLWQRVRVVALMEPDTDAAQLQASLVAMFPTAAAGLVVETLDDRDWSETWRDSFSAMRFGERLWVVPSGEDCPDPGAVVVHLDPGLAFGTGTHATTALCLEWLDAQVPIGGSVIDYGCGSGILAIAAHKLGAADVYAVDIDPQALQATRENALRNGIDEGLTVQLPDELSVADVDLVIANILANPLIELAGRLTGLLASGGNIIMTGILAEQADSVMAAYRDVVDFAEPVIRDEWVLLMGRKR